jgi:hypothetical protein
VVADQPGKGAKGCGGACCATVSRRDVSRGVAWRQKVSRRAGSREDLVLGMPQDGHGLVNEMHDTVIHVS